MRGNTELIRQYEYKMSKTERIGNYFISTLTKNKHFT